MRDFVQRRKWHYYKNQTNLQSTFKLKLTVCRACIADYYFYLRLSLYFYFEVVPS